ncbi:HlyD family efflux transporter periplasmic adaptor subunit, partial [bacterium]|nr:HlyD family efflux transporter periplasmic adaptor subunit [bacterium]
SLSQREMDVASYSFEGMERKCSKLKFAYDLMVKGPREEKLKVAEAEVDQAAAELVKAQWRLNNCVITAPVSGVILTKKSEEGNIINPAAFNISASLCEMADLTDLEVDLSIQERDVASVFKGQKCMVMPEAFQNFAPFLKLHPKGYEGVVSRLMPIADRGKGAIPVRVKIRVSPEEEGVYLKPDIGVIVAFMKDQDSK